MENENGGDKSFEISIIVDKQGSQRSTENSQQSLENSMDKEQNAHVSESQRRMENENGGEKSFEIISIVVDEQGSQRSTENSQQSLENSMDNEQSAYVYPPSRRNLYLAAKNGNWEDAEGDLKQNPGVYITDGEETSLHISALADKLEFVKKLVRLMNNEDLEKFNKAGNTALSVAASTGNVEIAKVMIEKVMIEKRHQLLRICGSGGTQPVMMAAKFGHGPMVKYFRLDLESDIWTDEEDTKLLTECIASNSFDVARKLIELKPALARSVTAWDMLTGKPMDDRSKRGKLKTFVDSWILTKEEDDVNSLKFQSYDLLKVMSDAASKDNLGISRMVKRHLSTSLMRRNRATWNCSSCCLTNSRILYGHLTTKS